MCSLQLLSPYFFLVTALAGLYSVGVGWAQWGFAHEASRVRRLLLCSAVVLPFSFFVFAVLSLSVNVPYWDDYDAILGYLVRPFSEKVDHLFALHNEHRIAFVRLIAVVINNLLGKFDFRAMIYSGNGLFLAYVACLLSRLKMHDRQKEGWNIPVVWALLSILMYENMLWALTAVQNNAVLLFAWLALLCLEGGYLCGRFMASLAFGVACTFTSGSGVFIWFCMAGLFVKKWVFDNQRLPLWMCVTFTVVTAGVLTAYFHGFHGQGALGLVFAHPLRVFLYVVLFCGASLNFSFLAFPAGILILAIVVMLLLRIKRVHDNVSLFFLLFLLCSVSSAAAFRCGDNLDQALSFRYRVVAVSIVICCGMLVHDQFSILFQWMSRKLCVGLSVFFIFMNFAGFLVAYPQLAVRRDALAEGLRKWPSDISGLAYPDHARAAVILERSVQKRIFRPAR